MSAERPIKPFSQFCTFPHANSYIDPTPLPELPQPAIGLDRSSVTRKEMFAIQKRCWKARMPIFRTRCHKPEDILHHEATAKHWGIPMTWWKYLQLFSGFLMNGLSWGIITSFGTFLDLYEEILGEEFSDGLLSMVGGTQVLLILFWSVVNGRLVDAGYHRWVMIWGLITLPLSFGLLSRFGPMKQYWIIWLFGGLGVGWGTACFGLLGALNAVQVSAQGGDECIERADRVQWFTQRNAVPVGIVSSGGAIGK